MEPAAPQGRHEPEVIPGERHQQPVFEYLLDRYAREFSRFHAVEFGADGRFVYPGLGNYWSQPGRFPFLITMGDVVAGFALVRRVGSPNSEEPDWDVTEFFVTETFRRRGVGSSAARALWRRFPGRWQVRVLAANHPAMRFWKSAIRESTGAAPKAFSYEEDGESWLKFTFGSPAGGDR